MHRLKKEGHGARYNFLCGPTWPNKWGQTLVHISLVRQKLRSRKHAQRHGGGDLAQPPQLTVLAADEEIDQRLAVKKRRRPASTPAVHQATSGRREGRAGGAIGAGKARLPEMGPPSTDQAPHFTRVRLPAAYGCWHRS